MIGDDFLVTFPLVFDVAENIIDNSAIESSNEYGALESLLQEAQENIPAAGEAAEAANQAAQSASNAANAANQAAGTASRAATAATNAAGSANTAAGTANQAATNATNAASQANQAKENADEAAGAANLAANQAMLKKVRYYGPSSNQDILDTAIDSSMLVGLSSTNNAELYEILDRASFAWVYQFFRRRHNGNQPTGADCLCFRRAGPRRVSSLQDLRRVHGLGIDKQQPAVTEHHTGRGRHADSHRRRRSLGKSHLSKPGDRSQGQPGP